MDLTALPDELQELVRAQLEAGRFESVDEILIETLRLLQEREELFASHRDGLRAQIAESAGAHSPEGVGVTSRRRSARSFALPVTWPLSL